MLKQKASVSLSEASLELLYEEEAVKLWEMAIIEALCARKAQSRHVLPISTASKLQPDSDSRGAKSWHGGLQQYVGRPKDV